MDEIPEVKPVEKPSLWFFFNIFFTLITGKDLLIEELREIDLLELEFFDTYIEVKYHDPDGDSRGSFTQDIHPAAWVAITMAAHTHTVFNPTLPFKMRLKGNLIRAWVPAPVAQLH